MKIYLKKYLNYFHWKESKSHCSKHLKKKYTNGNPEELKCMRNIVYFQNNNTEKNVIWFTSLWTTYSRVTDKGRKTCMTVIDKYFSEWLFLGKCLGFITTIFKRREYNLDKKKK